MTTSGTTAAMLVIGAPVRALASTGPHREGAATPQPSDSSGVATIVVLGIAIAVTLLVVCLPRWQRPLAALAVAVGSGSTGFVLVLIGLLSDWSGQHRADAVVVAGGIAVVLVGLLIARRIATAPRDSLGMPASGTGDHR